MRSPSNSRRIVSYGRPITCASTLSRPRCAMPITTSCAAGLGGEAGSPRRASARARPRPRSRTASGRGKPCAGTSRAPPPPSAARAARASRPRRAARGSGRTRSPRAARRAPRGRRCARSRTRSSRSRSRSGAGSASASVSPSTYVRRSRAGIRACSSGVSCGIRRVRLERGVAGRLGAERVEPRREVAVRPVRLDERHRRRDSAEQLLVAARPPRRRRLVALRHVEVSPRRFRRASRAGGPGPAASRAARRRRRSRRAERHSAGTESGFSRYCSSS